MTEEQIRQIIREELEEFLGSDRYTFHKLIQILDGRNIQLGKTTGTKIGTATDQKLGFYNASPVVQPSSADQADLTILGVGGSDTVDSSAITANFTEIDRLVGQLRTDLINLGLIKGSA